MASADGYHITSTLHDYTIHIESCTLWKQNRDETTGRFRKENTFQIGIYTMVWYTTMVVIHQQKPDEDHFIPNTPIPQGSKV